MSLPTPYVLGVKRRNVGSNDGHGNPAKTFAAAVDWPVHGFAPGAAGSSIGNNQPSQANRDLSVILWAVYAPVNDLAPTELDRVVLDGVEYDVEGRPADWSSSPWPFPEAGLVVELKRAEG